MNANSDLIVPSQRPERERYPAVPVAPSEGAVVMQIIERMSREATFDPAHIRDMLQVKKLWEDGEAEKAFNEAMAAFKQNPPQVYADKINKQYDSQYSSLGNFVNTVNAALGKHGLEASWDIKQQEKQVEVTCILAHARGHKRRVTIAAPPDTSGAKNPIQQIKSTITYLQLATYQAATGIAVQGASLDDDGAGGGKKPECISEKQIADLECLISEVGADKAKFLKYIKVNSLEEILAASYRACVAALEAKRGK